MNVREHKKMGENIRATMQLFLQCQIFQNYINNIAQSYKH